ncbi:MAG: GIY-YIG nuclease family protein [Candidatus Buchananbacteria bacterium]|nr:GIY-YIG nuclease family protein [Candidatus Buchananbacteria bacterium]
MFKTYVIKSITHKTRYIGSCEHLNKRMKEHNAGKCKYTKSRCPWELVYFEELETRTEARKRENFLKSGKGRKWLDEN